MAGSSSDLANDSAVLVRDTTSEESAADDALDTLTMGNALSAGSARVFLALPLSAVDKIAGAPGMKDLPAGASPARELFTPSRRVALAACSRLLSGV